MNCRMTISALLSMTAAALFADTIGLWHFEEREYGAATTGAAGEIVNAASSVYGDGRAVTISTGNAIGQEPSLMPLYDLPAALSAEKKGRIHDPVSGETWTSTGALRIPVVGSTTATRAGGAVIIGNDESFSLDTYTVECFVRLPRNYQALNTYGPIVGKVKGTQFYTESWALLLLGSGKLAFRYNGTGTSYTSAPGTAVVNDGEWHHLALVCRYDEEKNVSTWTIYCDGKADFSAEKSGRTEYTAAGSDLDSGGIFIGGYRYDGRKSNLRIDELRISDEALTPDEFLRLVPPDGLPGFVTDETLVWMPFDLPLGISSASELIGRNFNAVTNVDAVLTRSNDGSPCVVSASVPEEKLREGFAEPPTYVNGASLQFLTNSANAKNAHYIEMNAHDWFSGDFTVETYFKTTGSGYTDSRTILDFSDIKLFLWGSNPHYMNLSYRPSAGADQKVQKCGSRICDDGEWHHLAAVYSKEQGTIRVYVDHKPECEVSGVDLDTSAKKGRVGIYIAGSSDYQVFNGSIDSLRVTRAALCPGRFLNGRVNIEEPETLFRASFDRNLEAFSGDNGFTTGVAARYSKEGSEDPSYSNATNWGMRVYQDGEAFRNPKDNTSVLKMKGSIVHFHDQSQLTTGGQTCEFFCRLKSLDAMCGLVRVNRSAGSATGTPVWALYTEKSTAETEKMLIRLYGTKTGAESPSDHYLALSTAGKIFDDRWHHVALTFDETGDGKTLITMYRDYEVLSSVEFDGLMAENASSKYMISVGMSADMNKAGLDGLIDELRISRGVLPVSRFMRAEKVPRGLHVIFR